MLKIKWKKKKKIIDVNGTFCYINRVNIIQSNLLNNSCKIVSLISLVTALAIGSNKSSLMLLKF